MKLTILGGGGFRVPLVHNAVLSDPECAIDDICLYDTSQPRLEIMRSVLVAQAEEMGTSRHPSITTDLDRALEGADFVFSAIRVGGLEGRCCDERVALGHGLLGQETTGAGGLVYGLRTLPEAMRIAHAVARTAPNAWVINFTNPAGMITQAMQSVLGNRVIGICDSPIGLGRRAARALGLDPARTQFRYSGLNHLGWLHELRHEGRDVLPELLADPDRLRTTEEGRLFGSEWLQILGSIPNEYLYYYYFNRDAIESITRADETRGEYLRRTQHDFYQEASAEQRNSLDIWNDVHRSRDATYMKESRGNGEERDEEDITGGGYERVAVAIMKAISRDVRTSIILNTRNDGALAGLPDDAVVEIPCTVDAAGPAALHPHQLSGHQLGLVATVKECEMLIIEAARDKDRRAAVKALAIHPLVDSVTVAEQMLREHTERSPWIAAVLPH
ncbi:6-phospho-beta-glucosidase [Cutibacterium sp. V947]|uniref:6-phospho-beta-glucosidase n=1 Tax=unclassified Cutibacterium TaxID=2649671 RepID=UPI003EE106ED